MRGNLRKCVSQCSASSMENVNDRPTFGHGMPEGRQQELVLISGRVLYETGASVGFSMA